MEDRIKIEIEVVVTGENIDDILATALEGGINYWCDRAEVVGDYLGDFASEQISRGGQLKLFDFEAEEVYLLTKEKLIDGIKKYLTDPDKPYDILESGTDSVGCSKGESVIDCCMVDASVADMIIQYALFGEVIYG